MISALFRLGKNNLLPLDEILTPKPNEKDLGPSLLGKLRSLYMVITARVPTLWNRLAEAMHLKDSLTAEVTLFEHASFSFGRVKSSEGLPEIARPIAGERGYLVALQLKAIPFM